MLRHIPELLFALAERVSTRRRSVMSLMLDRMHFSLSITRRSAESSPRIVVPERIRNGYSASRTFPSLERISINEARSDSLTQSPRSGSRFPTASSYEYPLKPVNPSLTSKIIPSERRVSVSAYGEQRKAEENFSSWVCTSSSSLRVTMSVSYRSEGSTGAGRKRR
jgi:hypothetical protein